MASAVQNFLVSTSVRIIRVIHRECGVGTHTRAEAMREVINKGLDTRTASGLSWDPHPKGGD